MRPSSHGAAELYERNSGRVFGYCLSRLGRREDAEDATQLTFLHALTGLRRGIVPTVESAWLLGIARNVCLSRWALASRRSRVEAVCDPLELERLTSARDSERDELIGLEHALELLPEQQRRAVLLRDWRGLSYEEVAEQLGVSHAAVETLIFRGRAALADHLREQPSQGRRGLRSLGELGSLLNAIKGLFTGAAAGAKLAACTAAVVAVSGGGIALGTAMTRAPAARPAESVPQATPPRPAVTGAASRPATGASFARASTRAGTAAAPTTTTAVAASRTPAVPSADAPHAPAGADALVPAPTPGREPASGADIALPGNPIATPRVETPSVAVPSLDDTVDALPLDVPSLPSAQLPPTDPVVAAIDPITAVAVEILASAPPLPGPAPALPLPAAPEPPDVGPLLP